MDAAVHQQDPGSLPPPKRTKSWEAKNAIIYDASTQTLSTDDRSTLNSNAYTQVSIPKRAHGLQDRVQLSLTYTSPSINTFLANLRLDRLGFEVALQRICGNIGEIWVTGVPRACSVVVAR